MLSITGVVKIADALERLQKTVDAAVQANQVHIEHSKRVMQINEIYLMRAFANAHLEQTLNRSYKAEVIRLAQELGDAQEEIKRLTDRLRYKE